MKETGSIISREKSIIESLPVPVALAYLDGRVIGYNRAFTKTFGYVLEDIPTFNEWFKKVYPDEAYRKKVIKEWEDAIRICMQYPDKDLPVSTYSIRSKSGKLMEVELSFSIIGNEIYTVFHDITEKRKAEISLLASKDRLQRVMNSVDAFIYIADMDNYELLFVNEHGLRVWGRNIIGQKCYRALQGFSEPCTFCTNDRLVDRNLRPKGVYKWEFQNKVNGRWYDLRDRAFEWTDGRIVRMEVAIDITEHKYLQNLLNAKNKELEQLIFVASHDLRSPLVNIDGYGRELEYSFSEINDMLKCALLTPANIRKSLSKELPDIMDSLRHIRVSTRQMDNLIKGLLKLSRLGKDALNIEVVDVNNIIKKIISVMKFQIENSGAEISVNDLPSCRGDEVQLIQVFANILENALKYLSPNRKGRIQISGRTEHGFSEYCIEDNGIGIPHEYHEVIFELFHRLNPDGIEGQGLGLTIVRQILYKLDGQIRLESVPEKGTCFYVRLPEKIFNT